MSEPISDRPVVVTAEKRAHPALRMLARALLALAREQLRPMRSTAGRDDAVRSGTTEDNVRAERRAGGRP
jgi:hypothetical protein